MVNCRLAAVRVVIARVARRRRVIGTAVCTVLTALILAQTWNVEDRWAGAVPSAEQAAGSCHAFTTDAERYALSDVSPAVPCDQPHQTETLAVRELTGPFAARGERISPEERLRFTNELCGNIDVRGHLEAGPRDNYWYIGIILRLPTEQEWRRGVRWSRCELIAEDDDPKNLPWADESLRGVLTRRSGVRFRLCWTDAGSQVRCTQRHRSESVNATVPVPPDRFTGPAAGLSPAQLAVFDAWAAPLCEPFVSEFLGRPVAETRYRPVPHLSTDGRAVECGVGLPPGQPAMTGSLAPLTNGTER